MSGRHGSPLRFVLLAMLDHHAHGALPDFCENLTDFLMDSILSKNGASTKPGAVHSVFKSHAPNLIHWDSSMVRSE